MPPLEGKHASTLGSLFDREYTSKERDETRQHIRILLRPTNKCLAYSKRSYANTTDKLRYFVHRFARGWLHANRSMQLALALLFATNIIHMTSLVSRQWEYVSNELGEGYSGLWTVCVMGHCDAFRNHTLYGWFRIVQACMVLSMLTLATSFCMSALYLMARSHHLVRPKIIMCAMAAAVATVLLCACGVVIYGVDQGDDPTSLSWGYGLAVTSCVSELVIVALLVHECTQRNLGHHPLVCDTSTESLSCQELTSYTPKSSKSLGACESHAARPVLMRSESVPAANHSDHDDHDDVFCERAPLNRFDIRNRVNSYSVVPEPHNSVGRNRAVSFNVARERSESFSFVIDPYSRSYNIA